MDLSSYRTLGRSGLFVSPFALGTMTFGQARWGSDEAVSRTVFETYIEAGGNFIDTADVYSGGTSEEIVGRLIHESGLRERVVIATKFGFNSLPVNAQVSSGGNPQAGGNGRKNIYRAVDSSLERLQTDYIDLYWMHVWDLITPVEEVLHTLGDLQRSGRIRYFGYSDIPAWYAVKAATLAAAYCLPGPVAMQLEYGLTERTVEQEHIPAAQECGLGIVPWGPLGAGFLSGKYSKDQKAPAEGRLHGDNPYGQMKFTERNWQTLGVVQDIAREQERSEAQIALAWVVRQPGVTATILGARRAEQLQANLKALDVVLTGDQRERLDKVSALCPAFPYMIFGRNANARLFGGKPVAGWQAQQLTS